MTVQGVKLARASTELKARCKDAKVARLDGFNLEARSREALIKLSSAFPQLQPQTKISFQIDATITKEYLGGNHLRIEFRGDMTGFNAVKRVLADYDAKSDFDRKTLLILIRFAEAVGTEAALDMLSEKVGPFTEEALFDVTAIPNETARRNSTVVIP